MSFKRGANHLLRRISKSNALPREQHSGVMPIAPLLERCCMGVVSQIKDLDNSSKALLYKSSATLLVGEGLATPETFPVYLICVIN